MDVMLQRHCARYIYPVPDGLKELLSDISREVLRTQPEDLYVFIADYLDALLITRENARIAAKFVQHMSEASETIVSLLQRTNMSRDQVDRTAGIIQEAFRTWSERRGILKEDDDVVVNRIIEEAGLTEAQIETAAVVIQRAFRTYKSRLQRESQLLSGIIDWRVAARSAIKLYRKTGVSPEEAKRAANLIKAAYKGYYTRKAMRQLTEEVSYQGYYIEEDELEEEESDEEEGEKSKGVRINYESVVPHVDFDEEQIAEELIVVDEEAPIELPPEKSNAEYVLEILQEIIDCVIGVDDQLVLPKIEEVDSDVDSFMPAIEESEQTQFATGMPLISEDDIEEELLLVKVEADDIKKRASQMTIPQEEEKHLEKAEMLQEESAKIKEPSKTKSLEKVSKTNQEETAEKLPTVQEEHIVEIKDEVVPAAEVGQVDSKPVEEDEQKKLDDSEVHKEEARDEQGETKPAEEIAEGEQGESKPAEEIAEGEQGESKPAEEIAEGKQDETKPAEDIGQGEEDNKPVEAIVQDDNKPVEETPQGEQDDTKPVEEAAEGNHQPAENEENIEI